MMRRAAYENNVFERITDAFVAFDKNWNYTYVNKKAGELLGREPRELLGKNAWEEFPERVGTPLYVSYHKAMQEQEVIQTEVYFPEIEKWFEAVLYPSPEGLSAYLHDVTDARNTKLRLQESELRYRRLVENLQEGIWEIDENMTTTYVNQHLASLFGNTPEEMIGKNALDFLSEESRKTALKNIEERKKGNSALHELTLFNRQHEPVHALIQSAPFFKEGDFSGSLSMFLDITDRKKAEEQLITSEKRFRTIIENSSDGIILLSADGTILFSSRTAEKILGYTKEELHGADHFRYFHPDDEKKKTNFFADLVITEGKIEKCEFRYKHPDGSYKWISCSYSNSLHDPNINAIITNFRDITEQKNAEKQLRQNEEQLSVIFNNTVDAMWLLKVEGEGKYKYQMVNAAYTRITGIEKGKTIGKYFGEVVPIPNLEKFNRRYSEAIETGEIKKFGDSVNVPAGVIFAEMTIIPIKNEEGKVIQVLGVGNDITEQKKTQEELLHMNNQLRELASHLENIREEERTNMAREIHDELGQQLTVLKMDVAWLNKRLTVKDENIDKKLKGVLELIDKTIGTVRKISAELRPAVLDDLGLAEAIEWHSDNFTKHTCIPVEFSCNIDDNKFSPAITTAVFRIFQEALTNVARHAHATHVVCTLHQSDTCLNLIICDDGVGFDNAGKAQRKTLGLLGMKERVAMLGGNYSIESKQGEGTTLSFQFPLV